MCELQDRGETGRFIAELQTVDETHRQVGARGELLLRQLPVLTQAAKRLSEYLPFWRRRRHDAIRQRS